MWVRLGLELLQKKAWQSILIAESEDRCQVPSSVPPFPKQTKNVCTGRVRRPQGEFARRTGRREDSVLTEVGGQRFNLDLGLLQHRIYFREFAFVVVAPQDQLDLTQI